MNGFKGENPAEDLRDAARLIDQSMVWSATPQGHEYWRAVNKNLRENADKVAKSASCKKEIEELKKRIAELEERC